jgi:outer membrane immunogenic protein
MCTPSVSGDKVVRPYSVACKSSDVVLEKKRMKKILLGSVALAALSVSLPAFAADLPARAPAYTKAPAMMAPAYDWSGFYIGANGGGGWSHDCFTGSATLAPEGCHDASGGVIGGQVGYRWQMASWVFGVEAQGDWADLKGSNVSLVNAAISNQTKTDALGFFTGQIGYSVSNMLFYVKGGAAVADNTYTGLLNTGLAQDQATQTRWGGVIGAGIEYGFAPNWSVALEYNHAFLGTDTINLTTPAGVLSRTDNISQGVDIVTARINYRFGGPILAKY